MLVGGWEAASRRVPARRIPACENLSQLAAHPGRLMAGLVDDGAGLVGEATFQAVETPLQLVDDRLDALLEPLLELPGAGSQLSRRGADELTAFNFDDPMAPRATSSAIREWPGWLC